QIQPDGRVPVGGRLSTRACPGRPAGPTSDSARGTCGAPGAWTCLSRSILGSSRDHPTPRGRRTRVLAVAHFMTGFVLGNTGVMVAMLADATPRKRLRLAVGIASAWFPLVSPGCLYRSLHRRSHRPALQRSHAVGGGWGPLCSNRSSPDALRPAGAAGALRRLGGTTPEGGGARRLDLAGDRAAPCAPLCRDVWHHARQPFCAHPASAALHRRCTPAAHADRDDADGRR